jgi:hypothetical protein
MKMVHIGKVLKETMERKNIKVSDLAKHLDFQRDGVYKQFTYPDIGTKELKQINEFIGENLFLAYLSEKEIEAEVYRWFGSSSEHIEPLKVQRKSCLALFRFQRQPTRE